MVVPSILLQVLDWCGESCRIREADTGAEGMISRVTWIALEQLSKRALIRHLDASLANFAGGRGKASELEECLNHESRITSTTLHFYPLASTSSGGYSGASTNLEAQSHP